MKRSLNRLFERIFHPIHKNISAKNPDSDTTKEREVMLLSGNLEENIRRLKPLLPQGEDIVLRTFQIATLPSIKAIVIFVKGLVDISLLEASVLNPLTQGIGQRPLEERMVLASDIEAMVDKNVINSDIALYKDIQRAADTVLAGNGILLIDGFPKAVSVHVSRPLGKQHAEPKTDRIVKGPQESFVEDINANIAMIRRRVKSCHLVVKGFAMGRESKSEIRVVYMDNIADQSIVAELFSRLNRIDADNMMGSYAIEEYIADSPFSLFPTTFYTERPDRVQAMLLEGRIVLICDGTPFAIVVPAVFSDFFLTTEDYYQNYYFSSFNRLLGYGGAFIFTFLPSIYIAITTFHQEFLPTRLALTLAGTKAGVPYPAFVEALFMEIAFEGLREAGVRLPIHMGQAVSIVGALIIGQSAVEAGLVSPAVVIVVATTAIFSFTIPYSNFSLALRLIRFFNMALAATLGIYGIMTGALILALHLISLRSFGVPFMIPFGPLSLEDMKDWVLRFPQWAIRKRSKHIVNKNITKKREGLKPSPQSNERKMEP